MSDAPFSPETLALAAGPLRAAAAAVPAERLGAPTPCSGYDVRGLLNHLLFWGPSLEGAARKEVTPTPADDEKSVDLVTGDWTDRLAGQVDRAVAAWSAPGAWEGTTTMTGAMQLPAPMVGAMQVCELVLHGWDLTRALGEHPSWDDDVLDPLHEVVAGFVDQGRAMGAFGPEVPVPDTAPALDRLLGLAGRDPAWPA